jgi:endonuclease III
VEKAPFDINVAMSQIKQAVQPYPKAAMFELADDGYNTPFEQLVACILSIRTYDEVSVKIARRLFTQARTPLQMAALPVEEIDRLIYGTSFRERKAVQIQAIARQVVEQYGGELPCDEQTLLAFEGVGVKCAHLALGIACDQKWISVDIHVHRVTNRWGYVQTATPEKSMLALEQILPEPYWIEINRLLVPFGKHICTGIRPFCSTCPVLVMCRQVGVKDPR